MHVRIRRKPNDEHSTSKLGRRIRFSPSGTTKQSLKRSGPLKRENYRAEPETDLRRARYRDAISRGGGGGGGGGERVLKLCDN